MSNENSENYKKTIKALRDSVELENQKTTLLKQKQAIQPSERALRFDGEKGSLIYKEWVKKYKGKNPDFKEDENTFEVDENQIGWLKFSDPEAEEDFVRHLAANSLAGKILDKGIVIANFKNGKLIDPRTNEEFPKGAYASLVKKLDSGLSYEEINAQNSAVLTPFATTPY